VGGEVVIRANGDGILNRTFGHSMPGDIEPTHVAQFLQMSKETGGPAAGNRAKAALSSAFEFAMRKGWAKANPCLSLTLCEQMPLDELLAQIDIEQNVSEAHNQMNLFD